jgi:Concanavalin A-like lectin/glucanases superfamily
LTQRITVQIGTNTRYNHEWFQGAIDEVAVYDYALSADQVAAHYAAGTGP